MRITDEKISELAEKYAKDNFNNSPTAYYAFKEGMKKAINYTRCSTQLKDKEEEIIGNITSVGFTTPSNHGFLKIELPYSYYKIEKISKGDKIRLLIV